jgi:putative ABC transport system ATP-binding protein
MSAALSVRGVSKVYGGRGSAARALDGVDLDVESGAVTLLMGPSGSGKTTLISIMGCILQATSGSVRVQGRDVTGLSESQLPAVRLRHIGFVFQAFNLFGTLTAAENIELAFDLKGVRGTAARQRAAALLEEVGLGDKRRAYPAELSVGQKQRVAVARALAGDPEILLADEPTASLDSASGKTVMELLRRMAHERGRAVVVVTHDHRVMEYADRTVRMEDGRVI